MTIGSRRRCARLRCSSAAPRPQTCNSMSRQSCRSTPPPEVATMLQLGFLRVARRRDVGDARRGERGQALVLFVLSAFVVIGGVALVTDVSWLWYGQQRMQRAADAAALAGAIYLPGDPTSAYNAARNEATKNGFT